MPSETTEFFVLTGDTLTLDPEKAANITTLLEETSFCSDATEISFEFSLSNPVGKTSEKISVQIAREEVKAAKNETDAESADNSTEAANSTADAS